MYSYKIAGVALLFAALFPFSNAHSGAIPSRDSNDGGFFAVSRGLSSLGDNGTQVPTTNIALAVPSDLVNFTLELFDGNVDGLWDLVGNCGGVPDETVFELYRDPNLTGNLNPADLLYSWSSAGMPDDAWCELDASGACIAGAQLPQDAAACPAGSGVCNYNFHINWQTTACPELSQALKLSVDGQPFMLGGSSISFQGLGCVLTDPVCQSVLANPNANIRATTFDGSFSFDFLLTEAMDHLDFWDGDLDFALDTDDPNSDPLPPFPTSPSTLPEGMNVGIPLDDGNQVLAIPPNVQYSVTAPAGVWTVDNTDVSGNQEWEVFRIGDIAANVIDADVQVAGVNPGIYQMRIIGADFGNQFFINSSLSLYPSSPASCTADLEVTCQTAATPTPSSLCFAQSGETVTYNYTATNTSSELLFDINIFDSTYGTINPAPFSLQPSASVTYTTQEVFGINDVISVATLQGSLGTLNQCDAVANVSIIIKPDTNGGGGGGGEGCTPGYWKQKHHFDSWVNYSPNDSYSAIFGVNYNKTLLQALRKGGGGNKALGRHSVAALLNSQFGSGVSYEFTEAEIIAKVQDAYADGSKSAFNAAKDELEEENEMGCPLN